MGRPHKPRCRVLTPEEAKAVWAEPESNAGAGWWPSRFQQSDSSPDDLNLRLLDDPEGIAD